MNEPFEPHLIITTPEGEEYLRKGYCSGCGWCCQVLTRVKIDNLETAEEKEYAIARGIPLDGTKWFNVIEPCPLLTHSNKCTIYENRPKICKAFPLYPWQIEDSPCTYYFEKIIK